VSRPVVSADDVRAAHRRRETRLAVPEGALVTPLARDEAARWGIELVEEPGRAAAGGRDPSAGSPAGGSRPESPSRSATCDPSELDRLVERVRARVPGADPAQVREIARRVLERLG
jgi:hypothetical protein